MSNSGRIEETIFIGARDLVNPPERAAYLDKACGDDCALRERVERMLQAEQKADQFLANNPLQVDKTALVTFDGGEAVGSMIGRYKLLQQIGEGGCGVVYMAEQEQPIRRRVALKVIKPGMDTKHVIARFEAERQAVSMMDHPNIARVLDAGATEAGRPYFVMELVRGIRITDYCDQNNLATRERLDLFMKVVQAVQHAHQKGIIHRDIKPSNVLITLHDGVPVPKVIDFGIAKALEQKLTDKTLFTQFEQFIGTPAYTSPEQAEMSGLDIDTRSDIYSLGVLLYELLVGKTPFDAQALVHSGLDEMRRMIREQEPMRPSTKLSQTLVAADVRRLKSPSSDRPATEEEIRASSRRLLRIKDTIALLRGDLDWIVMKCLEKDRTRRYDTANGLGSDIEHYLGNEPVTARPPSRVYKFGKLVRRNKLAFAAGSAVVMALGIGIVVSTWQAARAHRAELASRSAEENAKAEMESAEAVLQFVRDKILAAGPEGQKGGLGKDVTLRKAIDAAESQISEAFKDRPVVEAAIRKTLGESYRYLGEAAVAVQQLERALELRQRNFGLLHDRTIGALDSLQDAYRAAGTPDKAMPHFEEIFKLQKARFGPDHEDTLQVMNRLGQAYWAARKNDQAATLFEEALKLAKAKPNPNHGLTLSIMNNLALAYQDAGKLDQAVTLMEETLTLKKAKLGADHGDTLTTMNNLAVAYGRTGKHDQHLALAQEVLRLTKAKRGPEHPDTLLQMDELGASYENAGKPDEALLLYEETLKLRKAKLGTEHPDTLTTGTHLGRRYLHAKKYDQALPVLQETFQMQEAKLGPDRSWTLRTMSSLAIATEYATSGNLDQALPLYEESFKLSKAKLGPEHPETLSAGHHLGGAYLRAEKYDQALPVLQETFQEMQKVKPGPEHPDTLGTMSYLAIATEYAAPGKLDQALPLYEETFKLMKATDHPNTLNAMNNLGGAYMAAGKLDQAEALYRERLGQKNDDLKAILGLARVLFERAKTDSENPARAQAQSREADELMRDYLPKARLRYTNDAAKLERSLYDVAELSYRQRQYAEAEPLYRELLQSRRARLEAKHNDVIGTTASLGRLLADWAWAERTNLVAAEVTRLTSSNPQPAATNPATIAQSLVTSAATVPHERAREGERLLSECLAVRLRDTNATPWRGFELKSRLGGALVSVAVTDHALNAAARSAKLAEAETLLLEGNQRLQASQSADKKYKRDALERLVRLYEAWGKSDQFVEWQQTLEAFDKAKTASSPPAAQASP